MTFIKDFGVEYQEKKEKNKRQKHILQTATTFRSTTYRSRLDVEWRRAAFVGWVELARDEVEPVALVKLSEALPPRLQMD